MPRGVYVRGESQREDMSNRLKLQYQEGRRVSVFTNQKKKYPNQGFQKGEKNYNWKGDKRLTDRDLKSNRLKRIYGITMDEFERRVAEQSNMCAIEGCFAPLTRDDKRTGACIDHNHKTGQVRGIICRNCNLCLGLLDDDYNKIVGLAKYIKQYELKGESIKENNNE